MRESIKFIKKNFLGIDRGLIGAEVGVRAGANALDMLKTLPIENLYLIDHYEPHTEHSGLEIIAWDQKNFYQQMIKCIEPYKELVEIVKKDSIEASKKFPDEFFDFVYIDAGHRYGEVLRDLDAWFPKVKKNGIFCGHDFNNKCTPEVKDAVKDFFNLKNIAIYNLGDIDWITIKE